MPQGTVAVRVVPSTKVTLVSGVLPRETVGGGRKIGAGDGDGGVDVVVAGRGVDGAHRGDDRRDGERAGQGCRCRRPG